MVGTHDLHNANDLNPVKHFILLWAQIPLWVVVSISLRNLSESNIQLEHSGGGSHASGGSAVTLRKVRVISQSGRCFFFTSQLGCLVHSESVTPDV